MKISERKQHLRARGVVPVPQATPQRSQKVRTRARAPDKRATARTAATDQKAPRRRWQPGPGYQMTFGLAYMIFSPFLFLNELALAHAPHAKYHPGTFEFLMPIVFFLFGAWWFVRGVQARRRRRAAATTLAPASKTQLAKGSPQ
jgi:cation transport ATPase